MRDHSSRLCAATYIRMSTEKQVYSVGHQRAAIAAYAVERGFRIVREYVDAGRSGLSLRRRDGLQQLLKDVMEPERDFDVILVLDISRWGRFQDTDESAHYEFLCRKAGAEVHYCTEMFENDGSMTSAVLKSLKRYMAGEFSRELSRRVLNAQCRLAATGRKMGGRATYGYRRLLVDQDGQPRGLLAVHQTKTLNSDSVILVPGPPEEIATVRRIFRLFVARNMTDTQIARQLNAEGVPANEGARWSPAMIRILLTSEKYYGANVFNKSRQTLGSRRFANPREEWVHAADAFPALIDRRLFDAAQRARKDRWGRLTRRAMLKRLRELLERHGMLTSSIIASSRATPSVKTYQNRFGSLEKAYTLAGYFPSQLSYCSIGRHLRERTLRTIDEVRESLRSDGARVDMVRGTKVLVVDGRTIVGVALATKVHGRRETYWRMSRKPAIELDYVLLGAMDDAGETVERWYLFPDKRFEAAQRIVITELGARMERYRIDGPEAVYEEICFAMR